MRLTIAAVPCAPGRFRLKIKNPGIVRYVAFEQKKALVMTQGRPDFEEVPILFVESSPDLPVVEHEFVVVNHGDVLTVEDDERATWVATGVSAKMGVVHVFEMREADT